MIQRMKQRVRRFARRRVPISDRFWELVPPGDGCREWGGTRDASGYGLISSVIGGKTKQFRAHRIAYALWNSVPLDAIDGVVMHSCDNPPCCNPDHLALGTGAENTADRHSKGRDAKGDRSASRMYPWLRAGERNGRAKLAASDVHEIRGRYAPGHVSQQSLAAEFGVSQPVISAIVRGERWKGEL